MQSRLREIKISLYGELELRNGLFQEKHARDCREIEGLGRIGCEEIEQARKAIIEELSLQKRRNPTTVSQMIAQIHDVLNKVNSFSDAREFMILNPGAALERPTFLIKFLRF